MTKNQKRQASIQSAIHQAARKSTCHTAIDDAFESLEGLTKAESLMLKNDLELLRQQDRIINDIKERQESILNRIQIVSKKLTALSGV